MKLDNIYLFEHSPEAIEAVKSGDAFVSTGGIRRKGEYGSGFLELAKPAVLSVADFQSLFEDKEHAFETDDRLCQLEAQIAFSDTALREMESIAWLNNAAIQRLYNLTQEGFKQTLYGLECVASQLTEFEQYIYRRDKRQLAQEIQTYLNYLKTDYGLLKSKKYSVTNGSIAEHLDQMSAMIKSLMFDIKNGEDDSFVAVKLLKHLVPPFAEVVRKYSALFYYENDSEMMPGNYEEWVHTISMVCNSRKFKEKLAYYINLNCSMPFKDKMLLCNGISMGLRKILYNVRQDREFIDRHSKEEYLSIGEVVRKKTEQKDYHVLHGDVIFFLDSPKETDNIGKRID